MKIANKKKIFGIIILVLLVISGLLIWNAPGVKSRRLGKQCDSQFNQSISTVNSEELRSNFLIARDICYTNIAREFQNTQLCDLIQDERQNRVCNINVYYWNKSIDDCEIDDQRNICLHIISIKKEDKSICSKISDESIKKLCLQ